MPESVNRCRSDYGINPIFERTAAAYGKKGINPEQTTSFS